MADVVELFHSVVRALDTVHPAESLTLDLFEHPPEQGWETEAFRFTVRETQLELACCSSLLLLPCGGIRVRVAPSQPFAPHLRHWTDHGEEVDEAGRLFEWVGCASRLSGLFLLSYKGLAPVTPCRLCHGGWVFEGIDSAVEIRVLLQALFLIIEHDHALRGLVRGLLNEANGRRWDTGVCDGDRLMVRVAGGLAAVWTSYVGDAFTVQAAPVDAVFERYIVWDGVTVEGARRGVLAFGDDVFVGVEDQGGRLTLECCFPEDQARIRTAVRALFGIMAAHLATL